MADSDKEPRRTSFAYQNRGELPGGVSDFYDDAGKALKSFGTAHDAQIHAPRQSGQPNEAGGSPWAHIPRKERLTYPDPHPPYALPARKAPDESFLRASQRSDNQLSSEDFKKQRAEQKKQRSRHLGRGR
jgi:hypothetical protein